jgi:hypothetical protein
MSLVAIVNLAQRLLNQTFEQGQDATNNTKQAKSATAGPTARKFEDQFTASAVNGAASGQEAGLFNVQRFAVFSAAADFLLSQPSEPTPPRAETPAVTKATPNDSAAPAAAPPSTGPAPITQPATPADQARLTTTNLSNTNQTTSQTQAPAPTEEVQATQAAAQAIATPAQPKSAIAIAIAQQCSGGPRPECRGHPDHRSHCFAN